MNANNPVEEWRLEGVGETNFLKTSGALETNDGSPAL